MLTFICDDCMYSNKGGKRNKDSDKNRPNTNVNPCWCHEHARCFVRTTGEELHVSSCPTDGTADCYEGDGRKISLKVSQKILSDERDCSHGRSSKCTKEQPCTPCEVEKAILFKDSSYCNICSDINRGNCHFKEGVGPYCRAGPHTDRIVPCGTCCTTPTLEFTVTAFNETTDAFNVTTYQNFTKCSYPVNAAW